MAKKEVGKVSLVIEAAKANPAPPVGPALGQKGVNISEFCKQFNERTKAMQGPVPVVITVFEDRSFTFITKVSPVSYLIKQAAHIQSGSKAAGKDVAGKITWDQVREIAQKKLVDMNAANVETAMNSVAGSARSMGVEVTGARENIGEKKHA